MGKDLRCAGGELSIHECSWAAPDAPCLGHRLDSVGYCARDGVFMHDGVARLLDSTGAPALGGQGLLQIFLQQTGTWTTVCGATQGAVSVVCKGMGFSGASSSGVVGLSKTNTDAPLIGGLSCVGSESSVTQCNFDQGALNVFCAPSEAVLVQCSGDGDTSGLPSLAAAIV